MTSATARVRSVDLAGPAGRLEALLNEGAPHARFGALVCHPHPWGGGSMHNKVVYHAMKVLNDPVWGFAAPVLRFNFRGTGLSQGVHDGKLEADDVRAAAAWLENEYKLPLVVAGFSFGAAMALKACCGSGHVRALAALGLPMQVRQDELPSGAKAPIDLMGLDVRAEARTLRAEARTFQPEARIPGSARFSGSGDVREYTYRFLSDCTIPKLFLSGDHDPYAPATQLAHVVDRAAEPKRLRLIAGADHFFTGQLPAMQQALGDWLQELPV